MLRDKKVRSLVASEDLVIDPFEDGLLEETKYEVRLGSELWIPKAGQVIDLRKDEVADYEERLMDDDGFVLEPKMFLLGQTLEMIGLPSKVGAMLDGKTKLAKMGVSIHQSSTVCDPGRKNKLTLEIFNAGEFRVRLYPRMRVGALVFFEV